MSDVDVGCDGCVHREWVEAARYATSASGWGCRRTGGHAVSRCSSFLGAPHGAESAPQAGDVSGAVVPESDGVGFVAPPCKFCGFDGANLPWPVCASQEEFRECFGDPGLSLGREVPCF